MLVEYTPIASLDAAAQARLKQAASGLLQTNEAQNGFVFFEGKYFSVQSLQSLLSPQRQILKG
jgi:hypothetical protein